MKNNKILFIIILIGIIALYILYVKFVGAKPKDSITMINGDVGSGKTSTGFYLVYSSWKSKYNKEKILNKFRKLFKKKQKELPYIYSNIPLVNVPYKEFTIQHLLREKRFEYNSVIFLNEASLVADSMLAYNMGKNEARKFVNNQFKLFCKLIRHELKGKGLCLVLDTQNPNDMALGVDRVLSTTNIILNWINWIPFIRPVKIRQIKINLENVNNNFNGDTRNDDSKWILVPKKIFKMYNSHCYEFLTREKEVDQELIYNKVSRKESKKILEQPFIIPTLTDYVEIKKYNEKLRKEKEENGKEKQSN